jgi:hypothetical protein
VNKLHAKRIFSCQDLLSCARDGFLWIKKRTTSPRRVRAKTSTFADRVCFDEMLYVTVTYKSPLPIPTTVGGSLAVR